MDDARGIDAEDLLTHLDWLGALARHLVADPDRARDLVQDTCLVALRKSPPDPSGIRGWLAQVLRNLQRQHVRSEERARTREASTARPTVADATSEIAERVALQRELARMVLELEEPGRSVILLRYYSGLPPRDIASRLEVSVAVVNGRIQRALARLRERLGSEAKWDLAAWSALLVDPLARAPLGASAHVTSTGAWTMAASTGVSSAVKLGVGVAVVLALGVTTWLAVPTAKIRASDAMPSATANGQTEATTDKSDHSDQVRTPVVQQASSNTADNDPGGEARGDADLSALGGQAPDAFLDSVALSFLTESPDLERLDRGMRYVAQHATVDPGSVVRDEASGKVEGTLLVADADIDASFTITRDHYEIHLNPYPLKVLPYPFERRTFSIWLWNKGNVATSGVDFSPDVKEISSAGFRLDRETITGWGVIIGPEGTEAQPMSMRLNAEGQLLLGPGTMPYIQHKDATDTTAYTSLLKLLQPYAQ